MVLVNGIFSFVWCRLFAQRANSPRAAVKVRTGYFLVARILLHFVPVRCTDEYHGTESKQSGSECDSRYNHCLDRGISESLARYSRGSDPPIVALAANDYCNRGLVISFLDRCPALGHRECHLVVIQRARGALGR